MEYEVILYECFEIFVFQVPRKPVPKKPQRKLTNVHKNLQIPGADLTLKAVTKKMKPSLSQQTLKIGDKRNETKESGIQTMTSEGHLKDDNSSISDATAETFETLHFGE